MCVSRFLARVTAPAVPSERLPSPNQSPELVPKVLPHEAVDDRVQAAVGVRQTHGQREHVGVHDVVSSVPVGGVQLDQHAPQGDGLVGHPAQEEGQDDDGDRLGDLRPPPRVAGLHAPVVDEAQQHDVADGNDAHWHDESNQDLLDVVDGQPVLAAWELHQAEFLSRDVGHGGEDRCGCRGQGGQRPDDGANPL